MVLDSSSWIDNGSLGNRKLRPTGHSVKQGNDAVPSTSNGTSPFPVKLKKTGNRPSEQTPAEQTGPVYSDQVAYEKLLARQREQQEAGSGADAAAVQKHANMPVVPAKVKIQKKHTVPPTSTSQKVEKNVLLQQGVASLDTNSADDEQELLVRRPTTYRKGGMEKQSHGGNNQAWLSGKQRNHPDNRNETVPKRLVSDKINFLTAGKPDAVYSDAKKESDDVQPIGLEHPIISNKEIEGSEFRFKLDKKSGAANGPKKHSIINVTEQVKIATDARADYSRPAEEIEKDVDDDKDSIVVEREENSANETREIDGGNVISVGQITEQNPQAAIEYSDEETTKEKNDVDDEPDASFIKEKDLVFAPIAITDQFERNGKEREELKIRDELPPTIVSTTHIVADEAKNDPHHIDVSNIEVEDLSETKEESTTPEHPETGEIWEIEKSVDTQKTKEEHREGGAATEAEVTAEYSKNSHEGLGKNDNEYVAPTLSLSERSIKSEEGVEENDKEVSEKDEDKEIDEKPSIVNEAVEEPSVTTTGNSTDIESDEEGAKEESTTFSEKDKKETEKEAWEEASKPIESENQPIASITEDFRDHEVVQQNLVQTNEEGKEAAQKESSVLLHEDDVEEIDVTGVESNIAQDMVNDSKAGQENDKANDAVHCTSLRLEKGEDEHQVAEANHESNMDSRTQDVLDDTEVVASEHKNTQQFVDESGDRSDEESGEGGNPTESYSGNTATPTSAEKTRENLGNAEEKERENINRNGVSSLLLAVGNGREEDKSKDDEVHDSAAIIPDSGESDAEVYDKGESSYSLAESDAVTRYGVDRTENIESNEEDEEDGSAHIIPEEEPAEQEATQEGEKEKGLDPVDVDQSNYHLTEDTPDGARESDDIRGQEQGDDASDNVAVDAENDYVAVNAEDGDKDKTKATNAETERDDSNQQAVAIHSTEMIADENCRDDIVESFFGGKENLEAKQDNKAVPENEAGGTDTADSLPSSSKDETGSPEGSSPDESVNEKHEVAPDAAKSNTQGEKVLAETVYKAVKVEGRKGSLILSKDKMRFGRPATDTDGTSSTRTIPWQKVLKHQASPAKVAKALLKVCLTDGKSILFRVKNRAVLGELQNDVQRRLDELEAETLSSTYPQIHFKSKIGCLMVSKEKLVFVVSGTKGGTKSLSWKKISKHMVTPASHAKNLLKLVLTTGKNMVFEFESRDNLMKIRKEITLLLRLHCT